MAIIIAFALSRAVHTWIGGVAKEFDNEDAVDKLSLGAAYQSSGYVVTDEAGRPLYLTLGTHAAA